MPTSDAARGPTLRLVCINDVYSLENLPRLRTLVKEAAEVEPADVLLTTLAGDFVGPSMLSSLDAGRGMIDCMNAIPITFVVLGNHEDDIGPAALHARIAEMDATCISTNVLGFDDALPTSKIVEVAGAGTRTVRVGLVGVVMDDHAVYHGIPFGGARFLPANATALAAAEHLVAEEGCAVVIPMTHQAIDDDRALAKAPFARRFPVIVGGHEHVPFLENIEGTWLLKAGMDAAEAVVVDLVWPAKAPEDGAPDLPEVRARVVEVARYAEDPALRAKVDEHMKAVHALEAATLVHLEPGQELSSVGTRSRQTSLGALLASHLRDATKAEAAFLNGGAIRAARAYHGHFTYGDLKGEVPFDNEVVVAKLPGRLLRDAIAASRSHAPAESGGFLQVDDGLVVEEPGHVLVSIGGKPLELDRDYRVALVRNFFEGMDHIEPLVRFGAENPGRVPEVGSGRDVKVILVEAFARALWDQMGDFEEADTNHDGTLDALEIAAAVARATTEPASPITVELLMRAVDANHDGSISRTEAEAGHLSRPRGPAQS